MKKQDFLSHFYLRWHFDWGEDPGPLGPPAGYAYDGNFNSIRDIKILCAILLVWPCVYVCQRDTNGFILCGHAKYVILLVKVKIVLNSSCNLKL